MSSVLAALDLAILRLNERLDPLPPFSANRVKLVEERNVLIDSKVRLERLLPGDRDGA